MPRRVLIQISLLRLGSAPRPEASPLETDTRCFASRCGSSLSARSLPSDIALDGSFGFLLFQHHLAMINGQLIIAALYKDEIDRVYPRDAVHEQLDMDRQCRMPSGYEIDSLPRPLMQLLSQLTQKASEFRFECFL